MVLRDVSWTSDTTTLDIFDRETSLPPSATQTSSPCLTPETATLGGSGAPTPPLTAVPGHLTLDLRQVTSVEDYVKSKRFTNAFVIHR